VMVVPVDDQWFFYFVSMFQIGTGVDTITFPKWWIKTWSDSLTSAQEELQEEIGMKAKMLVELWTLYSHPWRAKRKHHIILAQWLSVSRLEWDEIETIEILKLTQDEVKTMIMNWKINDAKTIASFYMAIEYLL
jgi:ADP-ribose pyrophosphatase